MVLYLQKHNALALLYERGDLSQINGYQEERVPEIFLSEGIMVALLGAMGGLINAMQVSGGIIFPEFGNERGHRIWYPGFVGNLAVGAVTAVIFWGLYNPRATWDAPATHIPTLIAALAVGFGGGKFLTKYSDEAVLQSTIKEASEAMENMSEHIEQEEQIHEERIPHHRKTIHRGRDKETE